MRALVGGGALGLAAGWNIANTGAVALELGGSYGVGLAVVGLFTTALFITHLAMQVPGGMASDRFGPRRSGAVGLAIIAVANAAALVAPEPALAIATRTVAGVGLGLVFIAGSAYVREQGGSPFAQGLFGGLALAGAGAALAVVPQVEAAISWRAPFVTALALALAALVALAVSPRDPARLPRALARRAGVLADPALRRPALVFAASFGLSVVVGNWTVTLLEEDGLAPGAAAAIGALTLAFGLVGRPLGGWIVRAHPAGTRAALALSLAAGAAGTALLATPGPAAVRVAGAAVAGLAAGVPFAPAFTGAASVRPDAPAAAMGVVNGAAALTVVVGTPLLGAAFAAPGGGRLGFVVVAALWAAAALALPRERELGLGPRTEAGRTAPPGATIDPPRPDPV